MDADDGWNNVHKLRSFLNQLESLLKNNYRNQVVDKKH